MFSWMYMYFSSFTISKTMKYVCHDYDKPNYRYCWINCRMSCEQNKYFLFWQIIFCTIIIKIGGTMCDMKISYIKAGILLEGPKYISGDNQTISGWIEMFSCKGASVQTYIILPGRKQNSRILKAIHTVVKMSIFALFYFNTSCTK